MDFLNHHFYLGLCIGAVLGLIGIAFAVMRLMDTKGEVKRLKRHLSDKLELESEATNRLRLDLQELKQQNENLRNGLWSRVRPVFRQYGKRRSAARWSVWNKRRMEEAFRNGSLTLC